MKLLVLLNINHRIPLKKDEVIMIITILEGRVTAERWESLKTSFRTGIKHIPKTLMAIYLVQDDNNPELWRIIAEWKSEQDFKDSLESQKLFSSSADFFRQVNVEPTIRSFKVRSMHRHI
jgi:quinol monooxygenase YgiN